MCQVQYEVKMQESCNFIMIKHAAKAKIRTFSAHDLKGKLFEKGKM